MFKGSSVNWYTILIQEFWAVMLVIFLLLLSYFRIVKLDNDSYNARSYPDQFCSMYLYYIQVSEISSKITRELAARIDLTSSRADRWGSILLDGEWQTFSVLSNRLYIAKYWSLGGRATRRLRWQTMHSWGSRTRPPGPTWPAPWTAARPRPASRSGSRGASAVWADTPDLEVACRAVLYS